MSFSQFQSIGDKSDLSGDVSALSPEIINVERFLARLLEQNDGKVSSDQVLKEGPKILSIDEATFRRMHDEIRKLNPNEQEALRHEFSIDIHYVRRSLLRPTYLTPVLASPIPHNRLQFRGVGSHIDEPS